MLMPDIADHYERYIRAVMPNIEETAGTSGESESSSQESKVEGNSE